MQEANQAVTQLVQFLGGPATGPLSYVLKRQDGTEIVSETVPVDPGQISHTIEIPAGLNTLLAPLLERLTLSWSYPTDEGVKTGQRSYIIHEPIPFPVTASGVRALLGVTEDEVPDTDLTMFYDYVRFQELIGETVDLAPFVSSGIGGIRITQAIEALSALRLIPTLQVRLPKKYDSGTSSYERWNTMDWEALKASATTLLDMGLLTVDPNYEFMPTIDIFRLSTRPADAITGV